jgi:hypothetical protein
MAISSIGATTSAVPKSAPVKPASPPSPGSALTAPATGHNKHHSQIGAGHLVNKLA